MNLLNLEKSPYLLQHAENPVHWLAWNKKTLDYAKNVGKPILVSIGYSTCHWCHVMERESFEKEEVAAYMNQFFTCIKVDKEEHPAVDSLYMKACLFVTGQGGWPLNVFLTPDLKPFYAGTYFPPKTKYGKQSWMDILQFISYNFIENRQSVNNQGEKIFNKIRGLNKIQKGKLELDGHTVELDDLDFQTILVKMSQQFDIEHGGFGNAPKFPYFPALKFLMEFGYLEKEDTASKMSFQTINNLLKCGIYDHLGGGMARYTVDNQWMIPHFEKMLYDNAQLIELTVHAYQITKDDFYKNKTHQTIQFWLTEMSKNKGIFSAMDADSEGVEGKFYIFDYKEILSIAKGNIDLYVNYYNIKKEGNWEGKNILHAPNSKATEKESTIIEEINKKLLAYRNLRIKPHIDHKILLGWNAMFCSSLAKAAIVFDHQSWRDKANNLIHFLLDTFKKDKGFSHVFTDGKKSLFANLFDYAYLLKALLNVYLIDFDTFYLVKAKEISNYVILNFIDPDSGLFYSSDQNDSNIPLRQIEISDDSMPNANAILWLQLSKLAIIFTDDKLDEICKKMIDTVTFNATEKPMGHSSWVKNIYLNKNGYAELSIIGNKAFEKAKTIQEMYLPHHIIMASKLPDSNFLQLDKPRLDQTLFYECKNQICLTPTDNFRI